MKKVLLKLLVFIVTCQLSIAMAKTKSTCYGTTSNGVLKNAVQLPSRGKNFVSYGRFPVLLNRTYVHSTVKTIVINAYKKLEQSRPGKVFKYAETGFKTGGPFKPHKTHQNGLSVDFMMPVLDKDDQSVHLPTHPLNRYGYDIEFDRKGRNDDYQIDFSALAAHIVALHKSAKEQGVDLWRVIITPEYKPLLYKTKYAAHLKKYITFSKRRSWVRHDEHYHVDFSVPCGK